MSKIENMKKNAKSYLKDTIFNAKLCKMLCKTKNME